MFAKYHFIWIMIIRLSLSQANAQFEEQPDCVIYNPSLIQEIKSGNVGSFFLWDRRANCRSCYGRMASSTLEPNEKFPVAKNISEYSEPYSYENGAKDWDCKYSAYNLIDNDPATAWVEGAHADGIGEVVISIIENINRPLKIWSGYGKSDALFKANGRPAKIKVNVLVSQCHHESQAFPSGIYYEDVHVIASHEVTLRDFNGYQKLPLPAFTHVANDNKCDAFTVPPFVKEWATIEPVYFVGVEILSVYKGSKYDDTCISEIAQDK